MDAMVSAAETTPAPASAGERATPQRPRAFGSTRHPERAELLGAVRWPRPSRLERPVPVPRARTAKALRALGVETLGDLLEHLPTDSREARTVGALRAGEQATVAVQVRAISSRPVRRRGMRPLVQAKVADSTGTMRATFFNQPWLLERYRPGTQLLLHGKADGRGGFRVTHHALAPPGAAAAQLLLDGEAAEAAGLREGAGGAPALGGAPIGEAVAHYPATEGITSTEILTLVREASAALGDVVEFLPAALLAGESLPERAGALAAMHFPRDREDAPAGRARLAFDELLLAQLLFLRRRDLRRARAGAIRLRGSGAVSARWLGQALPFQLTSDQRRAIEEVSDDLAEPVAMQRLLMGEVGSGKTVVALYAMLRAVDRGQQAALMAPTETLAEQHFATLQRLLGDEPVSLGLLTGSTPARRRADLLGKLSSGELSLVVGTHALIEPEVRFRTLALAVIDEQHRFGVRQRAALDAKGAPHTLHMTATPIPRTLALAGYGDLDTSTLRELPRGREPIATRVAGDERARADAYEALREQLGAGRQAYVVCPLIEEQQADGAAEPRPGSEEIGRAHV